MNFDDNAISQKHIDYVMRTKGKEFEVRLPVEFLLKIAKATPAERGPNELSIVIRRPYAHLEEELRETFQGQKDVQVIVDKRYDERRVKLESVEIDRRRTDRRRGKEELVEVVISP